VRELNAMLDEQTEVLDDIRFRIERGPLPAQA